MAVAMSKSPHAPTTTAGMVLRRLFIQSFSRCTTASVFVGARRWLTSGTSATRECHKGEHEGRADLLSGRCSRGQYRDHRRQVFHRRAVVGQAPLGLRKRQTQRDQQHRNRPAAPKSPGASRTSLADRRRSARPGGGRLSAAAAVYAPARALPGIQSRSKTILPASGWCTATRDFCAGSAIGAQPAELARHRSVRCVDPFHRVTSPFAVPEVECK
jgi:hypothetical protein